MATDLLTVPLFAFSNSVPLYVAALKNGIIPADPLIATLELPLTLLLIDTELSPRTYPLPIALE